VTSIEILPLGNVDRSLMEGLCAPVQQAFDVVVTMKHAAVPIERFYDQTRAQYNSTAILQWLHRPPPDQFPQVPASDCRTLAVISYDLFIPILTFVFGEAELGGRTAVVSYNRLQNERYGLPSDKHLLLERLRKESIHELGHAFGLVHCHTHECVMHTSTYVEDIDLKSDRFCGACDEALHRFTHSR
jgi:archaemetzincin